MSETSANGWTCMKHKLFFQQLADLCVPSHFGVYNPVTL